MSGTSSLWATCDLKIAAFLIHSGFEVRSFKRSGEKVMFEFDPSSSLDQTVMSFINKKTSVEPLSFMDSVSRARDLVSLAKNS
jgi:hypothetical protein